MFSKSNDARRKRAHDRRPDRKPTKTRKRHETKLLAGLVAGVIGGIVATWALDRYQEGALEARRRDNTTAAPIVRYTIGALAGGAYGFAVEILPVVRRGYGTGYSNLLFLGGSEAVLPWFNRGPRQKFQPASGGLSAPLVYGAVLETTRRILRWLL
ncbi:MAG TPA: hypothetical protein VGG80_00915 [Acidobacteriaceae bacterium]|jgi:hypothetical protein